MRLNKAITMLGMQAAGVHSGLLLEGALGALAHSSHNEQPREALRDAARAGLKAYLECATARFSRAHGPAVGQGTTKEGCPVMYAWRARHAANRGRG